MAQKDYLDLLVLIQEFGLPPELANETFETFEIQGRHSKIVISYDESTNKTILRVGIGCIGLKEQNNEKD